MDETIHPLGGHIIVRSGIFFLLEGALASVFGRLFVVFREQGTGFPWVLMIVLSILSAWISYYNCFWIFVSNAKAIEIAILSYVISMLLAFCLSWRFIYLHFDERNKVFREQVMKSKILVDKSIDFFDSGFYWAFWMTFFAYLFSLVIGIIEINELYSLH